MLHIYFSVNVHPIWAQVTLLLYEAICLQFWLINAPYWKLLALVWIFKSLIEIWVAHNLLNFFERISFDFSLFKIYFTECYFI